MDVNLRPHHASVWRKPSLIAIVGRSGSGKSSVLWALAAAAEAVGERVLWVHPAWHGWRGEPGTPLVVEKLADLRRRDVQGFDLVIIDNLETFMAPVVPVRADFETLATAWGVRLVVASESLESSAYQGSSVSRNV